MKKDSGRIDDCLFVMVSLLFVVIISLVLFTGTETLQQKIMINQIARQYILKMETEGCLQYADAEEMEKRLNEIGVTDVSFTGTTMSQTGYGMDIVLEFTGNLHCREISFTGLFSPEAADGTIPVHEKRVSTAKH